MKIIIKNRQFSVELSIFISYNRCNENTRELRPLKNALYDITDEDVPILNVQIDEVCFPIGWHTDFQNETVWMYWQEQLGKETVDTDALAEQWLKNLDWHQGKVNTSMDEKAIPHLRDGLFRSCNRPEDLVK